MKKSLRINMTIDKQQMLENIIEKLATRPDDGGYNNTTIPSMWQTLDTSFVESYISGTMIIKGNKRKSKYTLHQQLSILLYKRKR